MDYFWENNYQEEEQRYLEKILGLDSFLMANYHVEEYIRTLNREVDEGKIQSIYEKWSDIKKIKNHFHELITGKLNDIRNNSLNPEHDFRYFAKELSDDFDKNGGSILLPSEDLQYINSVLNDFSLFGVSDEDLARTRIRKISELVKEDYLENIFSHEDKISFYVSYIADYLSSIELLKKKDPLTITISESESNKLVAFSEKVIISELSELIQYCDKKQTKIDRKKECFDSLKDTYFQIVDNEYISDSIKRRIKETLKIFVKRYPIYCEEDLFDTEKEAKTNLIFDSLSGEEFEEWCASLLRKCGFTEIETTSVTGDQGVDIIADKYDVRYAIQCKCYSQDVGNASVQEVTAGREYYKCDIGVVMTNSYFTNSAKQLAAANKIRLWDRDKLLEMISDLSDSVHNYEDRVSEG